MNDPATAAATVPEDAQPAGPAAFLPVPPAEL